LQRQGKLPIPSDITWERKGVWGFRGTEKGNPTGKKGALKSLPSFFDSFHLISKIKSIGTAAQTRKKPKPIRRHEKVCLNAPPGAERMEMREDEPQSSRKKNQSYKKKKEGMKNRIRLRSRGDHALTSREFRRTESRTKIGSESSFLFWPPDLGGSEGRHRAQREG